MTLNKFIADRFDSKELSGLPLTVLLFSGFIILGVFLGLLEVVRDSNPILMVDTTLTHFLLIHRTSASIDFFYIITQFGSMKIGGIFLFMALFGFYYYKKRNYILPLVITLIGSEFTSFLIKLAIHRKRPGEDIAFYLEKTASFPSGHAVITMAFYGYMIYFFMRMKEKNGLSRLLAIASGLVILLVGFSRIYLGVHYLSDVVGGFLVGSLWLLMGISLTEILTKRKVKSLKNYLPFSK